MPSQLKSRNKLPWLYYPKDDSVRIINAHLGGGGGGSGGPATYIQHVTAIGNSVTSLDVTIPGVTAGSMLAVGLVSNITANPSYSVADNVNEGAYAVAGENFAATNRVSGFYYKAGCAAGDTTLTITPASGTRTFAVVVYEIANGGAVTYAEEDMVSGATKYAVPATGFSPPDNSIVLSAFAFNASAGSITKGTGYTDRYNEAVSTPIGLIQDREFATGETDHQPYCTVTTTGRIGPACAIIIEGT